MKEHITAPVQEKKKLMDSAVISAPGTFELQKTAIPEPAEDEVRIRLQGCGLCASNLPSWQGREWFSYPMEAGSPGHEGWGIIDEVGDHVSHLQPGERVTGLSYNAYADYDVAKADHLVKLPESLQDLPFPGEPLGCAMNIFKRSKIEEGMTVAIIGVGFLGALMVQLAKSAGARVVALSRRRSSLQQAERFGADKVVNVTEEDDIAEEIEAYTEGEFCERVIEATGKQGPLNLAARLTGVRGRLIIAGYHQDGHRKVDMQLWNWRGIDVINAHERDPERYVEGIQEAAEAVTRGTLDPFPLFTHTFAKEDIQQAFKTHEQKPEGFTKALITFD